MKLCSLVLPVLALAIGPGLSPARAADASAPRGTTLNVYDSGFALVSELRSVVFTGGDDAVEVRQLPARLDPSTISLTPVAGGKGIEVLEQRFEYDLASAADLLRRYRNRAIKVDGRDGKLLGAPSSQELLLGLADGSVVSFARPEQAGAVTFPDAGRAAYLEPTLIWRARSAQEGPQNLRLSYLAQGLTWNAAYDVVMSQGPDGATAVFSARVGVRNDSGGRFQDARVKLVLTEKGRVAPLQRPRETGPFDPEATPAQRYAYRATEPQIERSVASLAPVESYELAKTLTLEPGQESFVQLAGSENLPVTRFYVYDGVRFDRFQRNRRNDWNYGTESHSSVDTHLEFQNITSSGLGFNLPPGRVSLYQRRGEGALDLVGSDYLTPVAAGETGHARLGPARGLRGERERTGYNEVKPLHEYEESFEIRLANESDQDAQIRVVEHLYRWHDYEIVKSDAEYTTIAPQTIEFRPDLKPGGRRSIHYTVRYRW